MPTDLNRPFSEEEWKGVDEARARGNQAALKELYSPERRTRGRGGCVGRVFE